MDDTYAVLSRILGFSAAPRTIYLTSVQYISKDRDGMLIVNLVRSEMVDIKEEEEVFVHIMDAGLSSQ